MFDQSDIYSCERFNIHKKLQCFVRIIANYVLMTESKLKLNMFVNHNDNQKYVISCEDKIYLKNAFIASSRAIVCRETTCFCEKKENSENWKFVIKLFWLFDQQQHEEDILKLIKDQEIENVMQWYDHWDIRIDEFINTIANLQHEMKFKMLHKMSGKAV
jgi:hypothetical protein